MFCDQDDVWLEEKIHKTLKRMIEEEAKGVQVPVVVYADLSITDENLKIISPSMHEYQKLSRTKPSLDELLVSNQVTGCTMMANKEALKVSTPIPSEAVMHDWWIACMVLKKNGKLAFISEPLILYRQHHTNTVGAQRINALYFITKLLDIKSATASFSKMRRQAKKISPSTSTLKILQKKYKSLLKKIV